MRDRKKIESTMLWTAKVYRRLVIELLLDIRDLLIELKSGGEGSR